jgi:uncharacterized protein involved in response to NO
VKVTIDATSAGTQRPDISVPRRRVRDGDPSIDRRGRTRAAPAILSYGFRPFFLGAAIYAGLALPLWLVMYRTGAAPAGPFPALTWHAHEMIFGYLGAVMAGFALTAIPNWTGRLPLSGTPLAILFALWIAGRIASFAIADPLAALLIDLAFPLMLVASVWREIQAGKNWRNTPVALLLTLFAVANLIHHLGHWWPALDFYAVRSALGIAAVMIALIGGRITPSFTRNWLVKRGEKALPASFGLVDKAALGTALAAMLAWIAASSQAMTGALLILGGSLLIFRLTRWRGHRSWREPILVVLHLGYLWLDVFFLLAGLSILFPESVPETVAIHALTAGAIGTMTLAVMTRATLGHTGRAIETDRLTAVLFAAVSLGALLRIAAPFLDRFYLELLETGGALWTLAFLLFIIRYGPMLVTRRV